jgi:hypothetical protein
VLTPDRRSSPSSCITGSRASVDRVIKAMPGYASIIVGACVLHCRCLVAVRRRCRSHCPPKMTTAPYVLPSTTWSCPPAESRSSPGELTTGLCRLATQTMVGPGIPRYQMPRYVPLPPSPPARVKKPSSNTLPLDEPKDRLSAALVDAEGEARRVATRVRATATARRRRG